MRYVKLLTVMEIRNIEHLRMGLCAECVYGRRVESERGSVFILCERSASDAAFAKYPQLPVMRCAGYVRQGMEESADGSGE